MDNLINIFTQKSGLNQSQASTILTAVMQYVGKQLAGHSIIVILAELKT